MKSFLKFGLVLFALLFSVACTDAYHSKSSANPQAPTPQPATPETPHTEPAEPQPIKSILDLSGRSPLEVLQIKYKKIDFVCQMWNQVGFRLDKTQKPNHSFIWDLRQGLSKSELVLEALEDDDQQFIMVIKMQSLSLRDFNFKDIEGRHYKFQYSPVVSYTFNSWARYNTTEDAFDTDTFGSDLEVREVRERFIDTTVDSVSGLLEAFQKRYFQVECWIDSEILPEYENQFSIEEI